MRIGSGRFLLSRLVGQQTGARLRRQSADFHMRAFPGIPSLRMDHTDSLFLLRALGGDTVPVPKGRKKTGVSVCPFFASGICAADNGKRVKNRKKGGAE